MNETSTHKNENKIHIVVNAISMGSSDEDNIDASNDNT